MDIVYFVDYPFSNQWIFGYLLTSHGSNKFLFVVKYSSNREKVVVLVVLNQILGHVI